MRRRVLVVSVLALGLASAASACPVCVGDTDSQMAVGANNAVLFMLAMVGMVQLGLVALFVSIRRRTRQLDERREKFLLVEGGVR